MNRRPRHRTISSSERFGYVRMRPGCIPLNDAISRLRRDDIENARQNLWTACVIAEQTNQIGRILGLVEQGCQLTGEILAFVESRTR